MPKDAKTSPTPRPPRLHFQVPNPPTTTTANTNECRVKFLMEQLRRDGFGRLSLSRMISLIRCQFWTWTKWPEHHSQACVVAYQSYHGSMPLMRTGPSGYLQVSHNLSRKFERYLPIGDCTQGASFSDQQDHILPSGAAVGPLADRSCDVMLVLLCDSVDLQAGIF
jgi:hypothetical protein